MHGTDRRFLRAGAGGRGDERRRPDRRRVRKILPFIGHWDSDVAVPDGQDRGNCGGRTGDAGEKQLNCSMPVDQLPLNARGEAWLKYVDIMQSPVTVACAQLGLPALLTDGGYISASPGRVDMQHPTNPWYVSRTVWMNGGGPKPLPGQLLSTRTLDRALRRRRLRDRDRSLHVRSRRDRRPPAHGLVGAKEAHGALSTD